jgi:hypothetical protein
MQKFKIDVQITLVDDTLITEQIEVGAESEKALQQFLQQTLQTIAVTGLGKFENNNQTFTVIPSSQIKKLVATLPMLISADMTDLKGLELSR